MAKISVFERTAREGEANWYNQSATKLSSVLHLGINSPSAYAEYNWHRTTIADKLPFVRNLQIHVFI
jgi:hypothetical protein